MAKKMKSAAPLVTDQELTGVVVGSGKGSIINGIGYPAEQDVPTSVEVSAVPMFFDPAMITVAGNTRLKLKPTRVAQLAANIRELGRVLEPIGVEELASGGFELIYGRYRHAAVEMLNKDGYEIQLPALVYANLQPQDKLKMQVSENVERESLSLVDKALAMKALLDSGLSKVEVRNIFASGGRLKGTNIQPMSNIYLNSHLAILTLSKSLQDKIDDGVLGMGAIMKVLAAEPSVRDAIVKQAEVTRQAELEKEESAEDKFIAAENKRMEKEEKEAAAAQALIDAKAAISAHIAKGKELEKAVRDVNAKHSLKFNKEEADAWRAEMKEAMDAKIANEKDYKKASNVYAKLKEKAATKAEKPETATKADKPAKTSIGPAAIEQATKEVMGGPSFTKLKVSELESELKDMRKIGADSPAFLKIVDAFAKLVSGELTTKEVASDIAEVLQVVLSSNPVSRRAKK